MFVCRGLDNSLPVTIKIIFYINKKSLLIIIKLCECFYDLLAYINHRNASVIQYIITNKNM